VAAWIVRCDDRRREAWPCATRATPTVVVVRGRVARELELSKKIGGAWRIVGFRRIGERVRGRFEERRFMLAGVHYRGEVASGDCRQFAKMHKVVEHGARGVSHQGLVARREETDAVNHVAMRGECGVE